MKKWEIAFAICLILAIGLCLFAAVHQDMQSAKCSARGGVPVKTAYRGYQCMKGSAS